MDLAILNCFAMPLNNVGIPHLAQVIVERRSRVVLIGEQSHGTEEFYQARSDLAKLLCKSFSGRVFIVIEAAHVDGMRINAYVTRQANRIEWSDEFPAWLWNNAVSRDLWDWMRDLNEREVKVEVVGMDLYKPVAQPVEVPDKQNRDLLLASMAAKSHAKYVEEHSSWNVRGLVDVP